MTPARLEHLRKIDAHLERLLAIAENRTPGEYFSDDFNDVWAKGGHYNYLVAQIEDEETSSFIASCAGNAEAGWKATRAAIAEILAAYEARFESWCLVCQELNQDPGKLEDYPLPPWSDDILAAFPLELIQKP